MLPLHSCMRWLPPQAHGECSGHQWVYPGCCRAAEHTTGRKTYHTIQATFKGIACDHLANTLQHTHSCTTGSSCQCRGLEKECNLKRQEKRRVKCTTRRSQTEREVSLMVVVVQQIAHIAHLCFTGVWPDGKQAKVRACGQLEEVLDRLCLLL